MWSQLNVWQFRVILLNVDGGLLSELLIVFNDLLLFFIFYFVVGVVTSGHFGADVDLLPVDVVAFDDAQIDDLPRHVGLDERHKRETGMLLLLLAWTY